MKSKLFLLREIRELLTHSKKRVKYLTVEEKREMALRGEEVPICIGHDSKQYYSLAWGLCTASELKRKRKRFKL